jgi:hypothetical protein
MAYKIYTSVIQYKIQAYSSNPSLILRSLIRLPMDIEYCGKWTRL